MNHISVAEPGELSESELDAAEALVRSSFGESFRGHDWSHAVGGVHVMIWDGDSLVAHAGVVPRTLQYRDATFDAGYVEAVAVHSDRRGSGLGAVVMDCAESIIRTRHDLGALNAVESAAGFYAARGWEPWTGPTQALTPAGRVDTYDAADLIFVLPMGCGGLDASGVLTCDWRVGDLW
jgi:aminoglycoside 2'-N-acetyltransferase I